MDRRRIECELLSIPKLLTLEERKRKDLADTDLLSFKEIVVGIC